MLLLVLLLTGAMFMLCGSHGSGSTVSSLILCTGAVVLVVILVVLL